VRAVQLFQAHPSLRRYVLVPLLVNLVVGVGLDLAVLLPSLRAVDDLTAGLPGWAAVLGDVLRAVLVVFWLLVIAYLLASFGVLLGAPWYDRLAERLEELRLGRAVASPGGLRAALGALAYSLAFQIKKLLFVLGVGLLLLVVNVVPGLGQLGGAVGGLALAILLACLDVLNPGLGRRRVGFRRSIGLVGKTLPASAGLGVSCLFLLGLPVLNLLAVPVCVAAGALFFCDYVEPRLEPGSAPSVSRPVQAGAGAPG
jgi:CysZ protein